METEYLTQEDWDNLKPGDRFCWIGGFEKPKYKVVSKEEFRKDASELPEDGILVEETSDPNNWHGYFPRGDFRDKQFVWLERAPYTAAVASNDVYCSCSNPDKVSSGFGNLQFYVCKTCKKEIK